MFEHIIDFCNQGSLLAGKFWQVYCFHCTRATLITMEEDTSLVWRKSKIIMQERILPRQFEY